MGDTVLDPLYYTLHVATISGNIYFLDNQKLVQICNEQ